MAQVGVDKSQKYDRQLRLWGDHGQKALESSHVCLVNASSVGTEVLKSLVLPGLGKFSIVDENRVSGADAGCNFFLPASEIGKSRAEVACKYLCEMNEDVEGSAVELSTENLLAKDVDYFKQFSCVIATHLPERDLVRLSEACWRSNVPLLIVQCCGFVAYVRLQVAEHCVVEARPDNAPEDLRLDRPFPALTEFLHTQNLSTMDRKTHSHTPYVVLLHKFLEQWKEEHGTSMPSNYKEKTEFKKMLRKGIQVDENGVPADEENFDEALAKANGCLKLTSVPSDVLAILHDPCMENLSASSSNFWVLVNALGVFAAEEGCLPLRGSLPDMTADSERYITIQTIYRQKAAEDADRVWRHAQSICRELKKDPSSISQEETKVFCKNAAFLRVLRSRSFAEEVQKPSMLSADIDDGLGREDPHMNIYLFIRAAFRFYEQHGHYPGGEEDDLLLFKELVTTMTTEWNVSAPSCEATMTSLVASKGSELPSVTGFVGALVSQEVIKLLTCQFMPFNNTLIYSAKLASTATFQL
ncbi:NEDD8-activating enzyme E1 regulatory subunit-like [Sycon ciliatum]|uniref:NEDD8-activating enzyme E1 regulatory subunit-like n=1 Tax=Sycon ciliatum TaxID=27933 RepID=UPI0031F6A6F6